MAQTKGRQVQTAVLLDPATMGLIERLAGDERLSLADILRRLIRNGLEAERQAGRIPRNGTDPAETAA